MVFLIFEAKFCYFFTMRYYYCLSIRVNCHICTKIVNSSIWEQNNKK